ncbi:MmcB family DNA repair protein [Rhizobiales bacterium]|uniref:MmcB family DNA repair protein n=1 Tax=Hongsoonwoonella zoysiae TaxID=2821844 RepID=UPI001560158D|nr:MmcB family DNA repair protein [Hongsoonwoonella zoysiae]NRG16738.1 MmcB family DNA repair protein [Hongsoonwoonella zoysiae]
MQSNRVRLDDPLADGRQSDTAAMVWRGVARLFRQMGYASVGEVVLASGRRADLMAVGPKGEVWIVEVKSSIADFRADRKWPGYRDFCDRFFFASHAGVPRDIFPEEAGFILSDGFFADILREAPEHRLVGARRKAVTLRFAQAAANRLHDALDPDARPGAGL